MARFVLWGTYCADALVKRAPYRDEHLARLQGLKEQGTLVTLGPTEGSTHVFGIFEATTSLSCASSLRTTFIGSKESGRLSRFIPGSGVLSLQQDPFSDKLIPFRPKNVGITTHLAALRAMAAMASTVAMSSRSRVFSFRFFPDE